MTVADHFRQTTRLQDTVISFGGHVANFLSEIELIGSLEDVGTWYDVLDLCFQRVVWLTADAFIGSRYYEHVGWVNYQCFYTIEVTGELAAAVSCIGVYSQNYDAATEALQNILPILAKTTLEEIGIGGIEMNPVSLGVSVHSLCNLLQTQGDLSRFTLRSLSVSPAHCRALGAACRTVALRFENCSFADDDGAAVIDGIRSGALPAKIAFWNHMGMSVASVARLFSSLSDSQCLKGLELINNRLSNDQMNALSTGLSENAGLEELRIFSRDMSDDSWQVLCHSLHRHPSLRLLDLRYSFPFPLTVAAEKKSLRTDALLKMLQKNTALYDVKLLPSERDEDVFVSVQRHLLVNQCRVLSDVLHKADPIIRPSLFAHAIQTVSDKPECVHFLLSQNIHTLQPFLTTESVQC